ncbi:MAG TPA: hypothetical protein VHT27_02295 [Solirubrobacteraceae bacterium]|nr:hypothetical protein [Solirubrobacteraceae bacterium]
MVYTTAEGREQLLDSLATATESLGRALAELTEAFEQLDDANAERLEDTLFRPVQHAYGRARRAHAQFAERHELTATQPTAAPASAPAAGAHALIERAVGEVQAADAELGELQDSMLPVEVGDVQLREDLTAVRAGVGRAPAQARELLRTLGR